MSNNRYKRNKGFDSLKEEKEPTITLGNCCVCNKVVTQGFYGRYANGGTCSKKCEIALTLKVIEQFETTPVTSFNGSVFKGN